MTRGVPMLDPKRDLVGATPEKLARALLRNRNLRKKKAAGAKTPAKGDSVAPVTSEGASAGAKPDEAAC